MGILTSFKSLHFQNLNEKLFFFTLCLIPITLFLPLIYNSIAMGLLGIMWIINNPMKHLEGFWQNKPGMFLVALYLLHVVGLLHTQNMDYGLNELEFKLAMILIPIFIMLGPKFYKDHLKIILRIFYLSLFIFIIVSYFIGAISYVFSTESSSLMSFFTYRKFSTPVGFDPIYFAMYIVLGIFALVADQLMTDDLSWNKSPSIFGWVMLQIFFITLIFLSSRMEILVFIFCFMLLAFYFAVVKKTWLKPIISLLLVVGASYLLISVNTINKERFSEMVDLEADYTENKYGGRSIRIEKWKNAIETWQAAPLLGVGTGDTIDELMETYKKNEFDLAVEYRFNPHNQYLQTSVALGILGLALLLATFIFLLIKAIKNRDWLFVAFVLIATLSMLTESMLERQKGLVFIVFFAMIFSQYDKILIDKED